MRGRSPACSLSSSAVEELTRVRRVSTASSIGSSIGSSSSSSSSGGGSVSEGEGESESESGSGSNGGGGGSMAADSICSLDTFPRLSIGRVRPRSGGGRAIRLGPLRWRLPGRRRQQQQQQLEGRRRQQQRRQQQQQAQRRADRIQGPAATGGEYRLPRSLRPSSMFHLRLRYAAAAAAAAAARAGPGNHNKHMQQGPAGSGDSGPEADAAPGNGGGAEAAADVDVGGDDPAARLLPFPFSPSLSSLAVGSGARYFRFPSHPAQMLSPLPAAMTTATTTTATATTPRRPSAATCRCAQGGARAPMAPCLQCYFRSSVVPRRGKFVHTQAGPVLDLTSCPASAPLLGSSWPSLASSGPAAAAAGAADLSGSSTSNASSGNARQQQPSAASSAVPLRLSTESAGMQIRLYTRPQTAAARSTRSRKTSAGAASARSGTSVLRRPQTASASTAPSTPRLVDSPNQL
ncbi:hypothetical protein H4R18_004753, partial [Coemansia javaensis]